MAVPTITAVEPGWGHSGGVLCRIVGTNFQLPTLTGEVPEPERHPDVRVTFGTAEATRVAVWSATELYCISPELDPGETETELTADAGTDTLTASAHGLRNDTRLGVSSTTALPAPLEPDTAYWVVNATTDTWQLAATKGGSAIDLTDAGSGTHTAVSDAAVDVTVSNIDQDGDLIGAETATMAKAFRPLRPDLSGGSHLAAVLDTLIQKVQRQVVRNVAWTTHTDWDEQRNTIDIGYLSAIPGVVLAAIELPDSPDHHVVWKETQNVDDPVTEGTFLEFRPPVVKDVTGNIIGISNNPHELLALAEALIVFFKKNPKIAVPRDMDDLSLGTIEYDLSTSLESATSIVPKTGNDNIGWFVEDFKITGVRLETMPGLPNDSVPAKPAALPAESVVGIGKTADTIVVEATVKTED